MSSGIVDNGLDQCAHVSSVKIHLSVCLAPLCSSVGVPPLHHFGAFCLFLTLSGLAPPALREDAEGALGFIRLVTKSLLDAWPMGWRRHASATLHLTPSSQSQFFCSTASCLMMHMMAMQKSVKRGSICECASAHSGNLKRHISGDHGVLAPRVCHSTRGGQLFNLQKWCG